MAMASASGDESLIGLIMGPIVTFLQGRKVTHQSVTFGPMPPASDQVLIAFAARVNEICDDMGLPSERGRQSAMAGLFNVTNKAARKWLLGLGYPEMVLAVKIANWANVNLTWLLQGVGLKRGDRIDTKAIVLDEAIRRLPQELGLDLIDNLRVKLQRAGKQMAQEPLKRYQVMLDAYEADINSQRH